MHGPYRLFPKPRGEDSLVRFFQRRQFQRPRFLRRRLRERVQGFQQTPGFVCEFFFSKNARTTKRGQPSLLPSFQSQQLLTLHSFCFSDRHRFCSSSNLAFRGFRAQNKQRLLRVFPRQRRRGFLRLRFEVVHPCFHLRPILGGLACHVGAVAPRGRRSAGSIHVEFQHGLRHRFVNNAVRALRVLQRGQGFLD